MLLRQQIRTCFILVFFALLLTGTAHATAQFQREAAQREAAQREATQREAALVSAVNDVRASHGLRALAVDSRLARVARGHSVAMVRQNVFTHGAFGERIRSSGARGPRFGENLAWGTGPYAAATAIVRSWLGSPGHRANLLRPGFRRIGVGAVTGRFSGYPGATVVTADFAGT